MRAYLPAILLGIILASLIINIASPYRYPFTNDSAGYIEEAINFAAGGRFQRTQNAFAAVEFAPTPFQPPGYSFFIALSALAGFQAEQVALWLPRIAWALIPFAVTFCFLPVLDTRIAMTCGILVASSPGLYDTAYKASPDTVFLLLSILSFGLIVRAFEKQRSTYWLLFWSGFLASVGYALRNPGMAVFAAAVGTLFFAAIIRRISWNQAFKCFAAYVAGILPVLTILLTRNLSVFGMIQPYGGPTIEFGLLRSIRLYIWSMFYDLSGIHFIAQIAWDAVIFLLIIVPASLLFIWGAWKHFNKNSLPWQISSIVIVQYFIAGSVLVIYVRAYRDLSEITLLRHVMQYSWCVLVAMVLAAGGNAVLKNKTGTIIMGFLAVLVLFGHARFIYLDLYKEAVLSRLVVSKNSFAEVVEQMPDQSWVITNQVKKKYAHDKILQGKINELPANAYIISNYAKTLKPTTGRKIKEYEFPKDLSKSGFFRQTESKAAEIVAKRPLYWLILPGNRMLKQYGNTWQQTILQHVNDFHVQWKTADILMLRYKGAE